MKKQAGQSSRRSVDIISHLPEDVLNLVLVRLPIRDAVRMSILSKKWRHKWVSIPDIVFDKDCLMKDKSVTEHADVVDQVLLNHVGSIIKFSCTSYVPSCSHIDRWIAFLSRNGIKKIIIAMKLLESHYDVPSSIFNCQGLYHLELIICRLKVPPSFKGFQNLLVLTLDVVSISKDDTARLISKCPLLERLTLIIDFFDRFHIHAQNLRFHIELLGRTKRENSLLLIAMVALHGRGRAWRRISAEFNGRTAGSLKMKYREMQAEGLVEGNQDEENNNREDQNNEEGNNNEQDQEENNENNEEEHQNPVFDLNLSPGRGKQQPGRSEQRGGEQQ